MAKITCSNCKNRRYEHWGDYEYCMDYEMSSDHVETAKECSRYEYDDGEDDDYYCPSATHGDYSPSSPWNAPGMSISDFI